MTEPQDDRQASAVVALLRSVLGQALLGVALHGSAVRGGLRPTSDLDLLAVVGRPTTEDERRRIVDGILDVSGRRARLGPARPVELLVLVQDDLRPWRYPPRAELQYGEWLRDRYEAGYVPEPGPMADLAPVLTLALQGDHPLLGPPPSALLDPVPAGDLRAAIVEGIPGLLADLEPDTRNVLLTLLRIWATLATGEILSKDGAADWALAQLPPERHAVVERARAMYLGEVDDDRWDGLRDEVWLLVERVLAEIERARRS